MAFSLLKTPWVDKGPQPPEALFGSGGMYAGSAKALAEQGFHYKGGWPRHRRKLPLRNSRKSGAFHFFDILEALFPHDCAAADADGDRTVRFFGEPGIDL